MLHPIEDLYALFVKASLGQLKGWDVIRKFGANLDVDAAEDIWDGGGNYPWPAAAAETTIVSSDAADDDGGTGAITVRVYGLDTNWMAIDEVVTMNGVGAVTLQNAYLRVFRAQVLTAGSAGTNVGNITIKHGATTIAQITAGYGQTLMAIYTIPADFTNGLLLSWHAHLIDLTANKAGMSLIAREFGGAWQTKDLVGISDSNDHEYTYLMPEVFPAKTDIRLRANSVNNPDAIITAGFDMLLVA